ncbi:MAG: hypothetical protein JSW01_03155 [Candidatus Bathyarchaeota archaeon]|nr:MAG: hypothetical protein JSW01_03155 [Candidatus Bathyarchaeota archaeon]
MPKRKKKKTEGSKVQISRDPPLPKKELRLFFEHICLRETTSARRILVEIPEIKEGEEWVRGYIAGMEGMVSSLSDQRSLLIRLVDDKVSKNYLQNLLGQFKRRTQSTVGDSYDQGYFSVWLDLLTKISKRPKTETKTTQKRTKASTQTLENWLPYSQDTPAKPDD